MSNRTGLNHIVVDGSNLATEGRSMPSLAQLSEAVGSFMDEHPDVAITVVVDATFGHRIDKKEVPEFEAGISNNELVAPPAGAVGRGDAFVLGIADKAGASVLSNDSFQEFHGEYTWLFDEGRLIGGKPVPHVGWVWVDRIPVRGPISRKATRGSSGGRRAGAAATGGRSRRGAKRDDEATVRTGSKEASGPMPTPKTPPPGRGASKAEPKEASAPSAAKRAPRGGDPVNELMPFLNFVEQHPAGTSVNGTVDAYSSHGAYITVGDSGVRAYVPLRLMADPMPRSAKSIMKMGESVTVVVVSFAPARRSIDCAVPDMADAAIAEAAKDMADGDDSPPEVASAAPKRATKKAAGRKPATKKSAAKKAAAKAPIAKKSAAKKPVAKKPVAKKPAARKAPAAKKSVAKKPAAKKTATKKVTAAKKATSKAPVAEKGRAVKKTPAVEKATAKKKPAAKKAAAKAPAAKKVAANKSAAQKTTSKKTAAKKAAAKKSAANVGAPN